jgi:predicted transcriptional regulator with HTH domain
MKSATPNNTLQYYTIIKKNVLQVLYKLYKTKQYLDNIKQNLFTISRNNIVHDFVA